MTGNPLIERFRFSLLRPPQLWIYLGIYVTVVGLALMINLAGYARGGYDSVADLGMSLLAQFVAFQLLVVWVWTSVNVGTAIRDEVRDRSYDFFKLLPLEAWKKATGILLGKNLVAHILGLANFAFIVVFALVGRVELGTLVQMIVLIVAGSAFLNIGVLLAATQVETMGKRSIGTLPLILIGFFMLSPLLGLAFELVEEGFGSFQIPFYAWRVPGLLMVSALAVYFAVWMFKGVCRHFRADREPLMTPVGAMLFALGFVGIIFGFFWRELGPRHDADVAVGFWVAALVPTLMIPMGAIRSFEMYIEGAGRIAGRRGSMALFVARRSNLPTYAVVLAIWLGASIGAAAMAWMRASDAVIWLATLTTMAMVVFLLKELHVVVKPLGKKLHLVLYFVAGLYFLLPLIVAGVLEYEPLLQLSPLGFITHMFQPLVSREPTIHGAWIFNLVLTAVATGFLVPRYRFVLAARERMGKKS